MTAAILRDAPHASEHRASVSRRMDAAAARPESLPDLLAWFRAAWAEEMPARIHERGVEPQSVLGTPKLAGAFRAYMDAHPMQTDHDPRLDVDERGAARVRPIHAALWQMRRRWPLSARFLFALAWTGAEWQDVALAWGMLPEVGHRFTIDALRHLWALWERDQREVVA